MEIDIKDLGKEMKISVDREMSTLLIEIMPSRGYPKITVRMEEHEAKSLCTELRSKIQEIDKNFLFWDLGT